MSRRGDDDDEVAEDHEDFFGLTFLDGSTDDPEDDYYLLMGMTEADELPLSKFHAEEEARERLKEHQNADDIISEVKSYVKKFRQKVLWKKPSQINWVRKKVKPT